ncbi:FAD-dependent monooxygenase [Streptomyces sp. TRM 70351]|uniref:FAD-dependent monooxygenase n=1 Tax=Streptomyces sp. TRM 70351 TaxID=3116552 RepID=UPI002E7C2C76|nr:FAD-dependent monooxygenase [Streptomyces sp. TRM 70351]MEE1930797.1 FAD-dependent monooxygenase [Streptomyces sp. TRM 70351]
MGIDSAVVVGGGTTGLCAAVLLARRGVEVRLVEARADMGALGSGLLLHGNALRVLDAAGLADEVIGAGTAFDAIVIRRPDGAVVAEQPDLRSGGPGLPATVGITRPRLQRILADAAERAGVRLHRGARAAVPDGGEGAVRLPDGRSLEADVVVAADGARSALRSGVDAGRLPRATGWAVWRALVPRPAAVVRTELFYGGPAHIAGYSPMGADTAYVMCVVDAPQGPVAREEYARRMLELAGAYGGPVWEEVRGHLAGAGIHLTPFEAYLADAWYRGRVVLAGDAAHVMPPTLAQGAAMCLEDVLVLAEVLTGPQALAHALARYRARRRPRAAAVGQASLRLKDLLGAGRVDQAPQVIGRTLTALVTPP